MVTVHIYCLPLELYCKISLRSNTRSRNTRHLRCTVYSQLCLNAQCIISSVSSALPMISQAQSYQNVPILIKCLNLVSISIHLIYVHDSKLYTAKCNSVKLQGDSSSLFQNVRILPAPKINIYSSKNGAERPYVTLNKKQ